MGSPGTPAATQRPATGRTNNDHSQVVEAIVWLARIGAPWRDLPAQYGSWRTVASHFDHWRQQDIFERLLAEAHRRADACGELGIANPGPVSPEGPRESACSGR